MKKLITMALILVSTLVSSQNTEFTEFYSHLAIIQNDQTSGWETTLSAIRFNYRDEAGRVLVRFKEYNLDLSQVDGTLRGETIMGDGFQYLKLVNEYGYKFELQYFDDQERLGTRLKGENGTIVEFN